MSVSTYSRSSAIPSSAYRSLRRPSNANGFDTIATTSAPASEASRATTGAAPVPVPPPIPAVTKTMSEPARTSVILSASSRAALRPTSGFEPAPMPRDVVIPSWSFVGARLTFRT